MVSYLDLEKRIKELKQLHQALEKILEQRMKMATAERKKKCARRSK